ncbi:hypothetical protein DV515_00012227 [Chloebia gouldiae]|uniref:Integrase catalytic domain-containing protein n=1 Tax=Chloebia gouldiae TaxID=44316 RepID=A0A3L8S419_CHLGU|nr:hypothetical protein DV515_00012227 [Chloebia gouldiae]
MVHWSVLLKHVHVSVDTFSGAVYASAHAGEKVKDVINHLIHAFSVLGVPKVLKMDNAPVYASKELRSFLQQWGVEHITGIPHSLTGQAIVERTNQSLKEIIEHQRAAMKVEYPHVQLAQALFTYNFLNCAFENMNPPIVHHFKSNLQLELKERPPILIKDPEMWQLQGPFELAGGYGPVLRQAGAAGSTGTAAGSAGGRRQPGKHSGVAGYGGTHSAGEAAEHKVVPSDSRGAHWHHDPLPLTTSPGERRGEDESEGDSDSGDESESVIPISHKTRNRSKPAPVLARKDLGRQKRLVIAPLRQGIGGEGLVLGGAACGSWTMIAKPLYEPQKTQPFIWGKPQKEAFLKLKEALTTAPALGVLKGEIQKRTSWKRKIIKALTWDPHPSSSNSPVHDNIHDNVYVNPGFEEHHESGLFPESRDLEIPVFIVKQCLLRDFRAVRYMIIF